MATDRASALTGPPLVVTRAASATDLDLASATGARSRPRRLRLRSVGLGTASIIGGLVIWQLIYQIMNNPLEMAGPIQVVRVIPSEVSKGYGSDILVSGQEFAVGLAISIVLGLSIGSMMALNRDVKTIARPWLSIVQSTPLIALAPIIVVWFGIGSSGKVFIVTVIATFPMILTTEAGIAGTDPDLLEMAGLFGFGRLAKLRKVYVRSALPVIIAGLRLSVGYGLAAVIVAELYASTQGIGYFIGENTQRYNMSAVFLGVATVAVFGIILNVGLGALERRLTPWKR